MSEVQEKIMEVIIRSPGLSLEEIILECPNLTWNQVFSEIDRMSRMGQLRLTAKSRGLYGVSPTVSCNVPA
jgi:hypothetical protein